MEKIFPRLYPDLRAKAFAFVACDGGTKSTQSELLMKWLKAHGTAEYFHLPAKVHADGSDTITGPIIYKALANAFSEDFMKVHPVLAMWMWTVNRVESFDDIGLVLSRNDFAVLDGWADCNFGFQPAKLQNPEEWPAMIEMMSAFEYEVLGLPKPTILYLKTTPDSARSLMERRGKLDAHERDQDYQGRVGTIFNSLAQDHGWHVIECSDGGSMRSPEDIHAQILRVVESVLVVPNTQQPQQLRLSL